MRVTAKATATTNWCIANREGDLLHYRQGQYLFAPGAGGTMVGFSMAGEAEQWLNKRREQYPGCVATRWKGGRLTVV